MRLITTILLIVLILFLIATLLFWFMATASGHNIPGKTINSIYTALFILGASIGLVLLLRRNLN